MPFSTARSSSSADLPPGTLIAGFRVERVIGHGSRATVYEATQLTLDRRVAVKVMRDRALADRIQRLSWPEHPGAVSLFGAGNSEHGPWLAMTLVPGGTLATRRAPLDQVAAALAHAHAAGIVHGQVTARNVLVAGQRAYLSDFGLACGEATAQDDRAALARLVADHPPPRSRPLMAVGAGAAIAAAVIGVVIAGNAGHPTAAPPTAPAGTRPIGSDLAPGAIESRDCTGRPPGGTSPACTISQRDLAGRRVIVPVDGTITSWAVRGARGSMALQVLRGRGGRLLQVDRSTDETVPGPDLHVVASDLAVAAGDRVALQVAPGAAVGLRRTGPRASTERWFGPLLEPARSPERPAGTGLDRELLLRVDVRPGATVPVIEPLSGDEAVAATAGRRLDSSEVAVNSGEVRTVAVVVLGGAVAVDLLDGTRRLARTPVRGADGRGALVALTVTAGGVRVSWRNPSGTRVSRTVEVTAGGFS